MGNDLLTPQLSKMTTADMEDTPEDTYGQNPENVVNYLDDSIVKFNRTALPVIKKHNELSDISVFTMRENLLKAQKQTP